MLDPSLNTVIHWYVSTVGVASYQVAWFDDLAELMRGANMARLT